MFRLLCPLFVLLLTAAPLVAQTGSIDPTEEQLTGLRVFEAPEIELVEEKVVDLRRWLPPVGAQSMNDCTAWAVGYAAKSYLEARDQGWKPDAPQRIFSPSFLYNQMNGGKDSGSNFYKMIQFMAEHGAATLATAPYVAGDFHRQPGEKAKLEAKAFPVLDLVLIRDSKSVRRALQRRQVVIFGAHVNPIFLSGRFEQYGTELFVRDCKLRQPNQRHGKHAMVIVGYDDTRGCFLIQNSWGRRWNKQGYAWVEYGLFDGIKIAKDDSVFCNWACTMEDVEQPVEIGSDGIARPKPLDRGILKAKGYSDISRYDRDLGRFIYVFSADLRGPKALLGEVESVNWTWTNEQGREQNFTSLLANMRFLLPVGGTTQNPLKLQGRVKFKDGTVRTVETEIVGPNPKADFRDAKIIFEDDYYGPGAGGKPDFWWQAWLDFPLEQRDDITKVVWNLGTNMNRRDPVQTNTGFNGKPGEERAIGMCQKPSRISAEIHYIDGGIKTVHLDPVITDDVSEEFKIEVDRRRIGDDIDGRPLYSFVLTVDRPVRKQFDIDHVDWTLDPWFSLPNIFANQTFQRFPAFGTSSRDFRAIATLKLADGSRKTIEKWIVLGEGTAYADPDRIAIDSWNRYLGRESGTPTYTGNTRVVGDRRQLEKIDKVFVKELNGENQREYQIATSAENPTWDWSCSGAEEARVDFRIVFKDGREKTIRHRHRRTMVPDDNLGFLVDMQAKPETYLDFENQDTHLYSIRPLGPDQSTVRLLEIDWYHETIGYRERSRHIFRRTGLTQAHTLTSVLTKPFHLEARLHYHTGWEETLGLDMTRLSSGDMRPELSLRVREKFWGYENGKPTWAVILEILRDESAWPSEVAKATYTLRSIDREVDFKPFESTTATGYSYARIDRPCRVRAEVVFKDGKTAELEGFAEATAPRRKHAVHLLKYHNNYQVGHEDRWMLVLDAWESTRPQLATVVWDSSTPYEYFDREDDFSKGVPGMIVYDRTSGEPETMKVTARLKDGREWVWDLPVGEPVKPVSWTYSTTYWGNDWWQVDAWAAGDWWHIKDLGRSFELSSPKGLKFKDVGAWPASRKRAHAKAGVYSVTGGSYRGDGKLPGTTIKLGQNGEATPEDLSLLVAPSPFKHAEATVPEWIMQIRGPERRLRELVGVDYAYEDDKPRKAKVERRWGEFYAGFEHRAFGEKAPAVTATLRFRNGAKTVLKSSGG